MFRIALIVVTAGSVLFAAFVLRAGDDGGGSEAQFCKTWGYLPGLGSTDFGHLRLIVDIRAEDRSEGDCFFMHFDPDDLADADGVLFDDCVIWWKDGGESTAEREGIAC
jgi:hypothetical protein